MSVNPQDYDRDERFQATWWSSRHRYGSGRLTETRRNQRITLIDLVLLVVMAGVLVPLILRQGAAEEIGPFRVSLVNRNRPDGNLVILKIRADEDYEAASTLLVGWRIFDTDGAVLLEEMDLPPLPGETREFLYFHEPDSEIRVEVQVGERTLRFPPDESG